MFLREIVINGFKSFADRTRIVLGPGVTCIVGPNGCGKSNIVDSIRWVLGEQSAKALRGGKMQDVIFEGTDQRKALPMCEVSLLFTDCEKELGTNFNEVQITRRVSRDGSSDYFINGKTSRLKDIQRLFMDTGVGRVSYSFMVQGQIDQILSSNPSERRVIFEEAAGITRYKSQRKEALTKLGLVDQNLARVTDVIEEVSRQIGSLKRQASKALRFKRISHRLRHLDLAYNGYLFARRQAAIDDLEKLAGGLRGQVTDARTSLREREGILTAHKAKRAELYQRLQEAQQTVFDLRSEKEQAENQAEFAGVRRQDLTGRIAEIQRELEALEHQQQELDSKARDDASLKQSALEVMGSSDEVFKRRTQELEEIARQLSASERMLVETRQQLLILEGTMTRMRSACTTIEVDLKTFQVKHAGFADSVFQLTEERAGLDRRLADVLRTRELRQAEQQRAQEAVQAEQANSQRIRGEYREQQARMQELDRQIARGTAQLQVLEGLQAKFEGFSEGAKAILQGQLGDLLPKESVRPLTKFIKTTDESQIGALETLLGVAAEALVVGDTAQAAAVSKALDERKLGRACLQVPAPRVEYRPAENLPAWLRPALSVVEVREADLAQPVANLLAGCYFCPDANDFLAFWRERPDFDFSLVATPKGELIDRRGLVHAGHARGNKKESSFIQRETEIAHLRERLHAENARLTELTEHAMKLQADLEASEKEVEERRHRLVEIGQEMTSLQADERSARHAIATNAENCAKAQRQLEELENSRDEAERRMDKARAELANADAQVESLRQAIAQREDDIARIRGERDNRQEAMAEVRLDLAEKRQRLEMIDRGLFQLEQQRKEIQTRLLRRRQEVDTLKEQISSLEKDAGNQRAKAAQLATTLEATMATVDRDRQALMAAENEIRTAEESLSVDRDELRRGEIALNGYDVKLAEERSQAAFVEEKIRAEYQLEVRSIVWKRELWTADEEFETKLKLEELDEDADLEARPKRARGEPTEADLQAMDNTDWEPLAREIKSLRDRLASMGPVNLVAIEEYGELKERFDFLKTQSDDLWKSKEELVKAIDEINKTSQQLFQDTFEQIRKNFKFTFNQLFNGGEADLQLVQHEDVLDSGIDIIARPPGTKLKSLTLLSGGQKTMTAVALLFGIYMVKPSPFCVLDELDAPLDDANVGRFTNILRQFTKYSQFLVITHNKRTVSAANGIYGVTMQERGVTKLVSMRFDSKTGETAEMSASEAAAAVEARRNATAGAQPAETISPATITAAAESEMALPESEEGLGEPAASESSVGAAPLPDNAAEPEEKTPAEATGQPAAPVVEPATEASAGVHEEAVAQGDPEGDAAPAGRV